MRHFLAITLGLILATPALGAPAKSHTHTRIEAGLLPVHVDKQQGKILFALPRPGADGVSARYLYATALRTGLGSAPTFLDRGRVGNTQIIAFRRIGKKVAIQFENPRFRATGAERSDPRGSGDFAVSTVWMGDVAANLPSGGFTVDISSFLATDTLGIAASLNQSSDTMGTGGGAQGAGKGFKLDDKLSAAVPESVKVFPENVEIDAIQTYKSDEPGDEVENIAPDPHQVSFTVHSSFVALPAPGFVPRAFDPRIGGFSTQVVDFAAPLGTDVVRDYANRFRLEKINPGTAPSRVKKPIVYYIDSRAPEPIRDALIEGVSWWKKAFEAAGFIDAFEVKTLPPGVDPMDVRYNIVNWDDRATRGWSYGQEIVDPRTGEIVKGMVVLGSLRTRQDIQIFEGLVGADKLNNGGPNDPVRVALARLRQLGAHAPDDVRIIRGIENRGTGHKGVGPRRSNLADVLDTDAAVDFQPYRQAASPDLRARLAQFRQGARNERLSAETRVDAHEQHHVELVHDVVHVVQRRRRIEHQAGLAPAGADQCQRAVDVL